MVQKVILKPMIHDRMITMGPISQKISKISIFEHFKKTDLFKSGPTIIAVTCSIFKIRC